MYLYGRQIWWVLSGLVRLDLTFPSTDLDECQGHRHVLSSQVFLVFPPGQRLKSSHGDRSNMVHQLLPVQS